MAEFYLSMETRNSNTGVSPVVWLILIPIIALFVVAITPPVFDHHMPLKMIARNDMAGLANAVESYEQDYGRLPLPDVSTNSDITLGLNPAEIEGFSYINKTHIVPKNSDIVVILQDLDAGVNAGHRYNPRQVKYLNARMTKGITPGLSLDDYQYRDPWNHPYVISLDANHDGYVRDAFYANTNLYPNGAAQNLVKTNGFYEFNGSVTVWSFGPDGKASSVTPANEGVNRDNLASWQ